MSGNARPDTFKTRCPSCGATYKNVPRRAAGRRIKCRKCGRDFDAVAVGARPAPTRPDPRFRPPPDEEPATDQSAWAAWRVGRVIEGLYRVDGLLGEGGMGRVYRVRHLGWQIDLAVKVPSPDGLRLAGGTEQFLQEAETWVNLGLHPHTVSCYYVRRVDQAPCVLAEYVGGGNLHEWIVRPDGRPGALYKGGPRKALARILTVAVQSGFGLEHAHRQNLIHRDLKPANILISRDGAAKVTDFGLARPSLSAGLEAGDTHLPPGTPQYFSPEQADGAPVDQRSDLWSWALTVLEMFAGGRTWESGVVGGLALDQLKNQRRRPDFTPAPPGDLAVLLADCLAFDPSNRPRDLGEVLDRLMDIQAGVMGEKSRLSRPRSTAGLADNQNNRAVSLLDLGLESEAVRAWDEALRVDPHHPESLYNSGLLDWRRARLDDQALLGRLDAAQPGSAAAALLNTAVFLIHVERDDAEAAADRLDRDQPLDPAGGVAREAESVVRSALTAGDFAGVAVAWPDQPAAVNAVAFDPSSGRAWTGGDDGVLRKWSADGRLLETRLSGLSVIRCLAVDAHGDPLAGGGRVGDEGFGPLSIPSGDAERSAGPAGHRRTVVAVALDPTGRRAASGGDDQTIIIWDPLDWTKTATVTGHPAGVTAIRFFDRGAKIAAGSADGSIGVWDADSGRRIARWDAHNGRVASLSEVVDGRRLASAGADRTVHIWNLDTMSLVRTLHGHLDQVHAAAASTDGRWIASAGADGAVKLWDAAGGRCVRTFEGHRSWVMALAFSPDDKSLLSAGLGGQIRLWRIGRPARRYTAPYLVSKITSSETAAAVESRYRARLDQAQAAAAEGRYAAAARAVASARRLTGYGRAPEALDLWDRLSLYLPRTGLEGLRTGPVLSGDSGAVVGLDLDPDGALILSGSADGRVRLRDARNGRSVRSLNGHQGGARKVRLAGHRRLAVSVGLDRTARVWDLAGGAEPGVYSGHANAPTAVALSPDGRLAATADEGGRVHLWRTADRTVVRQWTAHRCAINNLAFSRDGRRLASAAGDALGTDCTAAIWNPDHGTRLTSLVGHDRAVNAVAVDDDGGHVLTGGSDGRLIWWDAAAATPIRVMGAEQTGPVIDASICPDHRWAATVHLDGLLAIWHLESGRLAHFVPVHDEAPAAVVWSADGRVLATAGADGKVRLWSVIWQLGQWPPTPDETRLDVVVRSWSHTLDPDHPNAVGRADKNRLRGMLAGAGLGFVSLDRALVRIES